MPSKLNAGAASPRMHTILGGTITASNPMGGGAEFVLRFP